MRLDRRQRALIRRAARKKRAANGEVPWSPLQLPGLRLWLDAAVGITLNGSDVAAWADRSGIGNHFSQAVEANQPAFVASGFNGGGGLDRPFVSFDGVTEYLTKVGFSMGTPTSLTMILLGAFPSGPTNGAIAAQYNDTSSAPRITAASASRTRVYSNGLAANSLAVLAPGSSHLLEYDAYAAGTAILVDGVAADADEGAAGQLADERDASLGAASTGSACEAVDVTHFMMCAAELGAEHRASLLAWATAEAGV